MCRNSRIMRCPHQHQHSDLLFYQNKNRAHSAARHMSTLGWDWESLLAHENTGTGESLLALVGSCWLLLAVCTQSKRGARAFPRVSPGRGPGGMVHVPWCSDRFHGRQRAREGPRKQFRIFHLELLQPHHTPVTHLHWPLRNLLGIETQRLSLTQNPRCVDKLILKKGLLQTTTSFINHHQLIFS